MKRNDRWVWLLMILGVFGTGTLRAGNSLESWGYSQQIRLSGEHSYKAVVLNEKVYQYARGEFVPYLVQHGFSSVRERVTRFKASLVRRFRKQQDDYYDFQILPRRSGEDPVGNQLVLGLPDQSFLKQVEIYAGFDGNSWEWVGKGQIYRIDRLVQNNIALRKVEKFNYYRIRLVNNAEKVELNSLELVNREAGEVWNSYQRSTKLAYQIRQNAKNTIVKFSNPTHLKLKSLKVKASGNFSRSYAVKDQKGVELQNGQIAHLKFEGVNVSDLEIGFDSPCSDEDFRLVIHNQDNPPLPIQEITADYFLDQVVFEPAAGQDYRLLFGNPVAQKPVYDLEQFQEHIFKQKHDVIELAEFKRLNPIPVRRPIAWDGQTVFNVCVLVIAVFLIILLLRRLSK